MGDINVFIGGQVNLFTAMFFLHIHMCFAFNHCVPTCTLMQIKLRHYKTNNCIVITKERISSAKFDSLN